MKHIYFIDYENTSNDILKLLLETCPKDSYYYLFYSEKTRQPEDILLELPDEPTQIRFIDCKNGEHDAMDFTIVAAAARLSAIHPNANYYIVSYDKGYEAATLYLQQHGIRIWLKTAQTPIQTKTEKKELLSAVQSALTLMNRRKETTEIYEVCKTAGSMQDMHNKLQNHYKNKPNTNQVTVVKIYDHIKSAMRKRGILLPPR